MKYEITIKQGLGPIRFGMPVEEIVALLGDPEEIETIDNACDEMSTVLHYDEKGLTLFCEGDSPSLQCIDTCDEDTVLFGKEVFGLDEKQIVALMIENRYFEEDADQEAWGERRISFPEGNIDFYFDDGELISIVYGL